MEVALTGRSCCAQLDYTDRVPGEPYYTRSLEILEISNQ